jgi:hypothetical protein
MLMLMLMSSSPLTCLVCTDAARREDFVIKCEQLQSFRCAVAVATSHYWMGCIYTV